MAKEGNLRPTTVITRDPFFGHRKFFSGEEWRERRDDYTDWDYILLNALQIIDDFTDQDGILVWERDDPRVDVGALKKISRFEASKTRATSGKNYKATPGEYFIPKVDLREGVKDWPTYRQFVEKKVKEDQIKNGTIER